MLSGKRIIHWVSATLLVALAAAHVRIVYEGNGQAIFWSNPSSVSVVIQSNGSDNISDGSDDVALRNAIAAWNDVTSTTATLVEVQSAAQKARTDWQSDDIHMFDYRRGCAFQWRRLSVHHQGTRRALRHPRRGDSRTGAPVGTRSLGSRWGNHVPLRGSECDSASQPFSR